MPPGFGFPAARQEGMAVSIAVLAGRADTSFYRARSGPRTAGVGLLFRTDSVGYLATAATLPEFRGRGGADRADPAPARGGPGQRLRPGRWPRRSGQREPAHDGALRAPAGFHQSLVERPGLRRQQVTASDSWCGSE
jgi:hypothetical protein